MSPETHPGVVRLMFRALKPRDDRHAFDCANESVNRWFREQAGQAARKGTASTTVGVDVASGTIVSFYALTAHRLGLEDATVQDSGLSRRYPIPAILIAQLGVDVVYQGKGVGRVTLLDALARLSAISAEVGFEVVIVDAIDDRAATFYRGHGFEPLTSDGCRLAITARKLRRAAPSALSED